MMLGTYTFDWWPDQFTIPQADRLHASVKTYSSVAFFSWGPEIVGKEIEMEWEWMSAAQYAELRALLEADVSVVWDTNRPSYGAMTYNVEILSVDGRYFDVVDEELPYREKVRVRLLILSEAGYGIGS